MANITSVTIGSHFFVTFISNQKALYSCFLWANVLAWSSVI